MVVEHAGPCRERLLGRLVLCALIWVGLHAVTAFRNFYEVLGSVRTVGCWDFSWGHGTSDRYFSASVRSAVAVLSAVLAAGID